MTVSRAKRKRVFIIELDPGGHRLVYVRILAEAVLDHGDAVVLGLSDEVLRSPQLSVHLAALAGIEIIRVPGFMTREDLARFAESANVTTVVIPDGDNFAVRELVRGWSGPPLRALIMRDPRGETTSSARRGAANLAKRASLAIASRRKGVTLVWLAQYGDKATGRRVLAYDPLILDAPKPAIEEGAKKFRSDNDLDSSVYWFGAVGAISLRKNVGLIADAVGRLHAEGRSVGLVLVGSLDKDLGSHESFLRDLQRDFPVVTDIGLKTNLEINVAVGAVNCVVTARPLHYPNSTMVKAIALGTRVVVAGSPFVQKRASALPNVVVCDLTLEGLVDAMRGAMLLSQNESGREFYLTDFTDPLLGYEKR